MTHTITAVSDRVDDWSSSKGGAMKTYRLKFQETGDMVVQLNQKANTTPPKVGDKLEGSVDMSGQYGPKFIKDYGGGYGGGSGGSHGGGKRESDPYTMYLSYAKDIAVAMIDPKTMTLDEEKYASVLETVITGGATLFDSRKKVEAATAAEPVDSKVNDQFPDAEPTTDTGGF